MQVENPNISGEPKVSQASQASQAPHSEHHTRHGALVRDAIIGFADGLTVPFALTAGLSSIGNSNLVILGGLAELFAGAISMGLGAYLAAVTDKKHYDVEEQRERREVKESPQAEEEEIYEIFEKYGIAREEAGGVVRSLKANEEMWVQFMMDFELKLEKPSPKMASLEGVVMGVSYFLGGLFPLIPYFIFKKNVNHALFCSIGITLIILIAFGYAKALVTGCSHKDARWSALQTLVTGTVAAGAAYGIVKGINTQTKVKGSS